MIFWVSILLSIFFILKTEKSEKINKWDVFFFLSSWQIFNLRIWQNYLADSVQRSSYNIAAIILILLSFWYTQRRGIKLGISFSKDDFLCFSKYFAILIILIPVGLFIGFLKFHPVLEYKFILENLAVYFLLVAPNEELIFRGIVQNLLVRFLKPWPSLLIATALFAPIYTHLSGDGIFPNWTYVGFAAAAGLAYGHSYLKSKNILVPILLHGSVDAIRRIFLS